jgi:hypothetical protein
MAGMLAAGEGAGLAAGVLTVIRAIGYWRPEGGGWWPYGCYAVAFVLEAVPEAAGGDWVGGVNAFLAVTSGLCWWFNRRNRKRRRALAALGDKSRALRDALVRKAREAARPRPALRPVPGGAR